MANKNEVLADILRPQSFDDMVGQAHLFGERGILRKMMEKGRMSNMIFFGPPGTGKTTAASIIAKQSGMDFYKINATSATLSATTLLLGMLPQTPSGPSSGGRGVNS